MSCLSLNERELKLFDLCSINFTCVFCLIKLIPSSTCIKEIVNLANNRSKEILEYDINPPIFKSSSEPPGSNSVCVDSSASSDLSAISTSTANNKDINVTNTVRIK